MEAKRFHLYSLILIKIQQVCVSVTPFLLAVRFFFFCFFFKDFLFEEACRADHLMLGLENEVMEMHWQRLREWLYLLHSVKVDGCGQLNPTCLLKNRAFGLVNKELCSHAGLHQAVIFISEFCISFLDFAYKIPKR